MKVPEDEFHMVFECPAYQGIRQQKCFAAVFEASQCGVVQDEQLTVFISSEDKMMCSFFCHDSKITIARFLDKCLKERNKILEQVVDQ